MEIRHLTSHDLPQVVTLYRRVFEARPELDDSRLVDYFKRIYTEHPWFDEEIQSLVCEIDDQIVGFLGVTARPLSFRGRRIRSAVSSSFAVGPEQRNRLVGVALLREFFRGPQDLSVAEGNRLSRKLWLGLGGSIVPHQSLHWICPLRPFAFASRYLNRTALRPVTRILSVLGDPLVAWRARTASDPPDGGLSAAPLTAEGWVDGLRELGSSYQLSPSYTLQEARWMLGFLERKTGLGRFEATSLQDRTGRRLGWYLWFSQPRGFATLMQIGAPRGQYDVVFDSFLRDAHRSGGDAAVGRLERELLEVVPQRWSLFSRRESWMLVSAAETALLHTILEGNVMLSPLEGERWLHFEE